MASGTMRAQNVFVALLAILLLADNALAATGPPLLSDVLSGIRIPGIGKSAAKIMSDYEHAERKSLNFHTTNIHNCNTFGCRGYYEDCHGAVGGGGEDASPACSYCRGDYFAETELSCVNDDDYSYRQKNTFLNYQSRLTNAASCSWEIRKFTQGWTIYEPDGVTQRRGKVTGLCTISDNAESCNGEEYGSKGPLCGGTSITIDAYWYYTPKGWWRANQNVPIGNDNLWYYCLYEGNPASWVCTNEDSCCLMDYDNIGFYENTNCNRGGARVANPDGARTGNSTAPQFAAVNPFVPTAKGEASAKPASVNGRRLQQTGQATTTTAATTSGNYEDPASATYEATTQSYNNDYYSGTYYMGGATVVLGTFYATNLATGEKWEEEGVVQWVVDTFNFAGSGNGRPPSDRFELEPNSVRFEFTKERSEYSGYTEGAKDGADSPSVSMNA